MIKKLVLLILIYYVTANMEIITFSEPESYILTPDMYKNASNIIVEVWGAGGGGCSFKCAIGGGSGSYIKASVLTNGETFNIKVGKGGIGGTSAWYTQYNYPNNYTVFSGTDGEESYISSNSVNLTVGGGLKGNVSKICDKQGYSVYPNAGQILKYKTNDKIITQLNGNNGVLVVQFYLLN